MKFSPIITIGRQYGSGGREVAQKLAQVMNVSFYDKELLAEASKDSGICQEVMETYDEKQGKRSFFSMMGGFQGRVDPGSMYLEMPLNHRIFLAQFDTIRKIADAGPCVIVGRCADYVLRDHENVLNVFIKASMEERIKRIVRLYELDPMKAEESIRQGCRYFAELLRRAEVLGCDSDSVIQAYNYGIGYLDYAAAEGGGVHTSALGEEYARIRSDGRKHPYFHPIAIRSNGGWKYSYGNMFYVRLVKRYLP